MNIFKKIHYHLRYKKSEWFEVVTEDGRVIDKAPREICHNGRSFYLHRVVHLLIVNAKGEMLLQKRSPTKDIQPGKWDTAVGGHINIGESVEEALVRETAEELGLRIKRGEFRFLYSYLMKSSRERELVNTFLLKNSRKIQFDPGEISEVKYWSLPAVKKNLGKGVFTPNFEDEFQRFLQIKKNKK